MNVGLGWLGVGVGAAGCVATYLLAGGVSTSATGADTPRDRRIAWICAAVTLVLTLVFWAIAMQRRVPFSPGQGLAWGWLIGGATGAVAIVLSFRLSEMAAAASAIRSVRLASLSIIFYGLFSVSLAYSLFTSNPWEALMGFAMGAAMAAIIHTYMEHASGAEPAVRTQTWALFAITIAAGILLAVRHFDATLLRMWWPLPILIATSIAVADYVGIEIASLGRLRDNPDKSSAIAALIGGALVAGLTAIYSSKIVHTWELLEVVAVGLVIGAIVAWLASMLSRNGGEADGLEAGAACVLLIAAFATVAFKLWAGLGIALGLLGIWAVAIPALGGKRGEGARLSLSHALSWPLVLGLVILLFRVFLEQYGRPLRTTDLQINYTFIGALLGAKLPFVFSASVIRMRGARVGNAAIAGVALVGLVAAAAPLLLLVLWEIKAVLGFCFGLAAAMAFMLYARLSGGDERYSAGLLAVASMLTAVQFTGPIMEMEITRCVRIIVLAVAVVLGGLWLGLSGLCAARRAR